MTEYGRNKRNLNGAGQGAIDFAKELMTGLTADEQYEIAADLISGVLPIDPDKKIKTCGNCGHFYRDQTRNNSSKTCSSECKTLRDTARRREQLNDAREVDPALRPRVTNKQANYVRGEYPFWTGYESMELHAHNYERPHGNIIEIQAASERYERMGGRVGRRERPKDYCDGDWDGF